MGVIYLRTNLANGMKYVGQTANFKKRENAWKSTKWRYANQLLTEDRDKYGIESFKTEILEICEDSKLNELEKYYIKKLNTIYPNGYNTNEGGTINFKQSEETKKKISIANSGENNGMFGSTPWNKGIEGCFSEETLKTMSEKLKGNTNATGHILSDESKKKISDSKTGVPNKKLAKPVIRILDDGTTEEYDSAADAMRKTGVTHVDAACRGEYHSHGHYLKSSTWFYKEEYEKMLGETNS